MSTALRSIQEETAGILARRPEAYARMADRVRARGGKYKDGYEYACILHKQVGRTPPTLAEYDALLAEVEG